MTPAKDDFVSVSRMALSNKVSAIRRGALGAGRHA
jgi:hypothetical protein